MAVTAALRRARDGVDLYDSSARTAPVRDALGSLWRYRALVRLLVERDLTVRYKRSLLGVLWTVLNPLLTAIVLWLVFTNLFRASIPGGVPYLVYVLSGLLVVTYFQQGVALTASSIAASANLLTKVHLPPVIFAFAAACSGAVNFVFGLAPLIVFQIVFGVGLRWTMLLIPVPLFFLLLLIAGVGFLLATFVIRFDDVLNLMNVLLMMMSYVTPTFYPVTIVDPAYQHLFYINPLYAYVNVFRYLDYGGPLPALGCLPIIVGTGVLGFTWGLIVFVRRWPSLAVYL